MIWLIIAALIALLDQISKGFIIRSLRVGETRPIVPGVFHITHIKNTGASWGMFSGARVIFIVITLIVLLGVVCWYLKKKPSDRFLMSALALICGGAVGNLLDRIITGQVTDFLDFCLIHFPVFNVADISITVGAILLFIHLIFCSSEKGKEK